jgi:hypothetical protein
MMEQFTDSIKDQKYDELSHIVEAKFLEKLKSKS